jgi:hypothetical protein
VSDHLKRDNLLWEGSRMFLPEHKEALRKYKKELQHIPKPILDEQKLAEMEETILEAIEFTYLLHFTYYDKGELKKLTGSIRRFDQFQKELWIQDYAETLHKLKISHIVDVQINSG